jgi:hypothetical protein
MPLEIPIKLCKDCKHAYNHGTDIGAQWMCYRSPVSGYSPVDGKEIRPSFFCGIERTVDTEFQQDRCGPDGKYFQPKIAPCH